MSKDKRFEIVHSENLGMLGPGCTILQDTETGVCYLFVQNGYSGGLTVLVDTDGKPLLGGGYYSK